MHVPEHVHRHNHNHVNYTLFSVPETGFANKYWDNFVFEVNKYDWRSNDWDVDKNLPYWFTKVNNKTNF